MEWYKGFQSGADLRHLTCGQIERYEALLGELTTASRWVCQG